MRALFILHCLYFLMLAILFLNQPQKKCDLFRKAVVITSLIFATGACNDTSEAMPFLAPSQQDKLDYANLPLTKSSCWVAHKKEGYVRAEITSTDGDTCQIESSKGDVSNAHFLRVRNHYPTRQKGSGAINFRMPNTKNQSHTKGVFKKLHCY